MSETTLDMAKTTQKLCIEKLFIEIGERIYNQEIIVDNSQLTALFSVINSHKKHNNSVTKDEHKEKIVNFIFL